MTGAKQWEGKMKELEGKRKIPRKKGGKERQERMDRIPIGRGGGSGTYKRHVSKGCPRNQIICHHLVGVKKRDGKRWSEDQREVTLRMAALHGGERPRKSKIIKFSEAHRAQEIFETDQSIVDREGQSSESGIVMSGKEYIPSDPHLGGAVLARPRRKTW